MKPITVSALINRNAREVWERWTSPAHIQQWAFASDDWAVGEVENDVRAGGKFKTRMFAKDGSEGFDLEGVYDGVVPNRSLGYRLVDGRRVDVLFEDVGGTTRVTQTFEPENENPEEMQRAGWQAILDNFKKHAEQS